MSESANLIGLVHGIGSAWGGHGYLLPLLLIDKKFAPKRWREERPDEVFVPYSELDDDIRQILSPWEVPKNALIQFEPAAIPMRAPSGSLLHAEEQSYCKHATLGFYIKIDDGTTARMAATTAGHFVDNLPHPVFTKHTRYLIVDSFSRVGSIQLSNDPIGQAGVDVALIELVGEQEAIPYVSMSILEERCA
jgi:hypothetical protein